METTIINYLENNTRELHLLKQHGYFIVEGIELEDGVVSHSWYDCYNDLAVAETAFSLYKNWLDSGNYPVVPIKLAYASR